MYSPSLTLRLTAIFTLIMALACGGISLILYNALRSELVWRDDQTLINRAAQLRQLLEDGAQPESLPLYFNRMVDIRQDILSIRPQHAQNVTINHTGVALPDIAPTRLTPRPARSSCTAGAARMIWMPRRSACRPTHRTGRSPSRLPV